MQGLGLFPFGLAPAGLGLPGSVPAEEPIAVGVPVLDPSTGDFAVGADGRPVTTTRTQAQRVQIALSTKRESVVGLPNFGIRLIKTKGADYQRSHRQNIVEALRHIDDIRVNGIAVPEREHQLVESDIDFTSFPGPK